MMNNTPKNTNRAMRNGLCMLIIRTRVRNDRRGSFSKNERQNNEPKNVKQDQKMKQKSRPPVTPSRRAMLSQLRTFILDGRPHTRDGVSRAAKGTMRPAHPWQGQ